MVRPDKVEGILVNLMGYVERLRQLALLSRETFLSDFTKVESAKHLFQVSVECCLDISNHIIASERFRAPRNYVESFEILTEHKVLPESFLPTLRKMVQFRNRLVHLYWDVDAEVVYDLVQKDLEDFDTFARSIAGFITRQEQSNP